jgi:hypothetical protein
MRSCNSLELLLDQGLQRCAGMADGGLGLKDVRSHQLLKR